MIKASFYIDKIIFKDFKSDFQIMSTTMDGKAYTLLGECNAIEGETIDAEVEEVKHPKYGKQYSIVKYKKTISADLDTVSNYILEKVYNSYEDKEKFDFDKMKENISYLLSYNLNYALIEKICSKYKNLTSKKIKKNPYIILDDFVDVNFNDVDKIALELGVEETSDIRIEAVTLFALNSADYNEGHVFLFYEQLRKSVCDWLNFEPKIFDNILAKLQLDKKIVVIPNEFGDEKVYTYDNYFKEDSLSKMLLERKENIQIITGGPGTGKTTMLKDIAYNALSEGRKVMLLAPTGRAAKRMYETTQIEAKTIHRALEFTFDKGRAYFRKDDENKLDCDILIVDEMSMVDFKLMYHLILATDVDTKIYLVGDKDQLPSVGSGQVLSDMIESKLFETLFLTKIHRQSENSDIIQNAHKINNKEEVDLDKKSDDFVFIKKYNDDELIELIIELLTKTIPKKFKYEENDVQIICASKKGNLGTFELNKILQNTLNPKAKNKKEITINNQLFRINDKVMQNRNNYELFWELKNSNGLVIEEGYGIFNGEMGTIVDIDKKEKSITINFDGKEVRYNYEDVKDLTLAYAITVHKSQGSEYPILIFPIVNAFYLLLYKNLLYTGLTRAKKIAYLVGDEKIFYKMEQNDNRNKRNSALCK